MNVEIKIDGLNEVKGLFRRLRRAGEDLTPVMRKISFIMLDAVEENFEKEGRPRWTPLAPSTIKERKRIGRWPGKMLQRSAGGLAASVSNSWNSNSARAGTNKVYAAIHQFGGRAGRNREAEIPARAFLALTNEDIAEIRAAITAHIMAAEKGR